MADQVDSMSDAELRTKLAEHGYPVMPITASTRKLLVKKLKLVLDNKTKPRSSTNNTESKAETRRSLARYSSGEESDLDSTNNVKEKRGRRATTAGAMPPPVSAKARRGTPKKDSPLKRDSDKESESEDEKSPVRTHEEVETVTTRRVTRTYANAKDGDDYETGSDSDVDTDRKTSKPYRSSSRSSDYISSTLPTNDAATSPPKTSIFSRPSLSSNYSPSLSSSDQLNSIRSRLGLTTSLGDRTSSSYTPPYTTSSYKPSTSPIDEVESPYLSNFTRRLTALKTDPKTSSFIDREGNNGSTLLHRRSYVSSVARPDISDYKSTSDKNFLKNNLVSLALVGIAALFFFCLFFMYIVKRNDITSVADDQTSVIPICQLNIPGDRPGINCVPKDQVSFAKGLLKHIHPELIRRTANYNCGKQDSMPYMTEREILELASQAKYDMSQSRADLNNLQVMLVSNPRWGLRVVALQSPYSRDPAGMAVLASAEAVVRERARGGLALALHEPSTPLGCLLLAALYSAGSTLAAAAAAAGLALGARAAHRRYQQYKKRRSDEVYSMVEQIIDVISAETEDSGAPYTSVDHVRDTLIPPGSRERQAAVWDAAVKFIQSNESRVRMEVQSVDGEDCRVWRWLARGSPARGAAWQGQAFETQEGSVNNLSVSPTNCLKIRHMFPAGAAGGAGGAGLRARVTDALLQKAGGAHVLHVAVERAAGCVYAKCASAADAGRVYRSLHGWWYEGRLITVKYLRLERYQQRFPDAPAAGPPLQPSRQKQWDD